tara:strand:+ start:2008 stop:4017 length:2010 start_codon:yes stop_codon:yes gene_type:complete
MKKFLSIISLSLLLFLSCCSDISMISRGAREDLYTSEFLSQIDSIKSTYKRGDAETALKKLKAFDETKMLPSEKAMRRNLIGVIYFGKANYEQAIFNFDQALATSRLDESLTAQIYLNLSSSYYKLGMSEKAFEVLRNAPYTALEGPESIKFHKLRYRLAQELGHDREALISLIYTLSQKNKISELRIDPLYEILVGKFRKLDQREKYKVFEEFEETKPFVIGYLSYLEAEKVYYSGKKDEASDLIGWISDNFRVYPEIANLIDNFTYRVENYAKLNRLNIGVVLPLSGKNKSYGQRALMGIDAALRELKKTNPEMPEFKIIVRDSKGSGVVGANQVRNLVENDFVSVIIGGLYSTEATKEFESAKKRGVFYISLSQVYLDKEDKDHLLLEVPGSIESQMNELFSEEVLTNFGKRAAIVYPESKRGMSYVNEFWRKAKLNNIPVAGVYGYDKETKDFRAPIKNLLGLKYPRARMEEYKILQEIHELEDNRTIRRIQTLGPQMDFDWVFIPMYPLEAIQIIPVFKYYDAKSVPVVGGPSWRSKRLSAESYKFNNIHFVGDDVANASDELGASFSKAYKKSLGLIELRAFDSMKIALDLLTKEEFETRDELDMSIRGLDQFVGKTGEWALKDGIWLKKMASLYFRRGKIIPLKVKEVEEAEETVENSQSQQ